MSNIKRPENHPDVRIIMAAFDRACASPTRPFNLVASSILSFGHCSEDFGAFLDNRDHRGDWTPEQLRAVLLAYAQHAPEPFMAEMVEAAKDQHDWVEWWDRDGEDIAAGRKPDPARAEAHS